MSLDGDSKFVKSPLGDSIRVIFYDIGPCVSTCSSARFQRLSGA